MSKKVTYIKTSSISRKFSQLIAAIVLLIVTLNIWASINFNGHTLIEENAQVLADNILLQSSHSAAYYIANEDIDSLNALTESALKSPYILEMVIYDHRGVELSKSLNAQSTIQRFLSSQPSDINVHQPTPYVQKVLNEQDELLGFIRVTVLAKLLQKDANSFITTISKRALLLALLAGVIGYLLTIGLRPFSANAFVVRD
jgi:uncharacterized membrane protein affecting hemolysin expression